MFFIKIRHDTEHFQSTRWSKSPNEEVQASGGSKAPGGLKFEHLSCETGANAALSTLGGKWLESLNLLGEMRSEGGFKRRNFDGLNKEKK